MWHLIIAALSFLPILKASMWTWDKAFDGDYPSKGEQVIILFVSVFLAVIWPMTLVALAIVGFFYLIRPLFFHNSSKDD